jgi:dCTP deaminase
MTVPKAGALAAEQLQKLIESEHIKGATEEHISPASLDMTLSEEAYQIQGLLLPRVGETVRDALAIMQPQAVDLEQPLRAGQLYLIRLRESVALPESVYGYCNPKSSTGRLDTHVRVLADGVPRYDSLTPKGYCGELWVAVYPQSFSLQVHPGTPLTQLRLFTKDTRLSEIELANLYQTKKLVWHPTKDHTLPYEELLTHDQDGAILLTAYINEGVVGYECIAEPSAVIDVAKVGQYAAADFFAPLYAHDEIIYLKRDRFYILSGAERVRIPPTLASEMVPMDERSGDFRSHYAGFLDPGWGWGTAGEGKGRPFTLEVRPFEDLLIRAKQPIAKIKFEHMAQEPAVHYDTKDSNYLCQSGPKLAKQFRLD